VTFLSSPVEYWLDVRDAIARVNDAWTVFALANDAPELAAEHVLHRSVWDFVVDGSTRHLYSAILQRVRGGATIRFPLRCDSPALRRHLAMVVGPEAEGAVRFTCHVRALEARPEQPLWDRAATRRADMLRVCSWCKRVDVQGAWKEVEQAVGQLALFDDLPPPTLTHGLCPDCAARIEGVIRTRDAGPQGRE
jgi:hypothetical protein